MQIPDGLTHLNAVSELAREGADLTGYFTLMERYQTQLNAAMSTFGLATQELLELAETIANDCQEHKQELRLKSVTDLRAIAKRLEINGRSRMAKDHLIDAIHQDLKPTIANSAVTSSLGNLDDDETDDPFGEDEETFG